MNNSISKSILLILVLLRFCLGYPKTTSKKHIEIKNDVTPRYLIYDSQQNRNMISRAMQCLELEIVMKCPRYFFSVWESMSGEMVYSSHHLDDFYCYDPSLCYRFELVSESNNCDYWILMNGTIASMGVTMYSSDYNGDIIYTGNCNPNCPSQNKELVIISYNGYGDIDYTLYTREVESGFIKEGNSKSFCLDLSICSIMARLNYGFSFYYLLNGTETIEYGDFNKHQTFGNCFFVCKDITLLIAPVMEKGDFNYTLLRNGQVVDFSNLTRGESKNLCLNTKDYCYELYGEGAAQYYLFQNEQVYDNGKSSEYRSFGNCPKICDSKPVLSNTKRGKDIVLNLATVSGMESLSNFYSPHYQAACWLIHDDLQQKSADDPFLIQRYILGLLYITTDGMNWEAPLGFMSGKNECDWDAVTCKNGYATKLELRSNNLVGPLITEITSLVNLEYLSLYGNHLYGKLPTGFSRLDLKYLDIQRNFFSGNIPHDLFLIKDATHITIGRNLFTGSIPSNYVDLPNLKQLWIMDNSLTGRIPDWIYGARNLEQLYLDFNSLRGSIAGNSVAKMYSLRSFRVNANQLTGTVPIQLFNLPVIRELTLDTNNFVGPVPNETENDSLVSLTLNDNRLTSTIPKQLSNLSRLKQLYLSNNRLSGQIPYELTKLKHLNDLRVESNNLTGTIYVENCNRFITLSSDCYVPQNIVCKCCTQCFGIFSTSEDILPCQSNELTIAYDSNVYDKISFSIKNQARDNIPQDSISRSGYDTYKSCISPTDCFTMQSSSDPSFSIYVDDQLVLGNVPGTVTNLRFGYSSDNTIKVNTCDDLIICNETIYAGSLKRNLLNMITKFEGLEVFNETESIQYLSMCWWLDDSDFVSNITVKNTALTQRYILVLLYHSVGGANWYNNSNWLSRESECTWYGISCDEYPNVVDKIDLSSNNLDGALPTLIGELKGLRQLILSSNKLRGFLPINLVKLSNLQILNISNNMFDGFLNVRMEYLRKLKVLDFSENRFSGTLSDELGVLDELVTLNLSRNSFSGAIPLHLGYLQKLRKLSLAHNLFKGGLFMIKNLTSLEYIDLSHNYFTGRLPLYASRQIHLRIVHLNNNKFSESIPSNIDELTKLQELVLMNNLLTGSLPSQIGQCRNLTVLSLSYNVLKGTISTELANLQKLSILHLHSNKLTGSADHFNYSIDNFVADCGTTEILRGPVDCHDCSECCNIDGSCITVARTWPKTTSFQALSNTIAYIVISFIGFLALILLLLGAIMSKFRRYLPQLSYVVKNDFSKSSAYRFFLTRNICAWIIALLTVLFQLGLIGSFIRAGQFNAKGNLWAYSVSCPDNELQCSDYSLVTTIGWVAFGLILATFLLIDFLNGILLFYESCIERELQGAIASSILLIVTILSVIASTIFIYATSISNIAIIKDAVIVLFLNTIDEQVYLILDRIAPKWLEELENEIFNRMVINMLTDESCELLDIPVKQDIACETKEVNSVDIVGVNYECDDIYASYNKPQSILHDAVEMANDNGNEPNDTMSTTSDPIELHNLIESLKNEIKGVKNDVKHLKNENAKLKAALATISNADSTSDSTFKERDQ